MRRYSGFDQIADQENFIVVYVQEQLMLLEHRMECSVVPTFNFVDDVGLLKALIKYFKASYNIDGSKYFQQECLWEDL